VPKKQRGAKRKFDPAMIRYARVKRNVAEAKKRVAEYRRRLIRRDAKKVVFVVSILVVIAVAFFVVVRDVSVESAADRFREFGPYGPLLVVLLIVLEVVVTPIPGVLIIIATGYAFGPYWGMLYSYIGGFIGVNIAFFLSRKFGRPLVEKLTDRKKLVEFDRFAQANGKVFLWIAFLIPVFPSDMVCYGIGLTNMRWRTFASIVMVAMIPGTFLLNQFGGSLRNIGLLSFFLGVLMLVSYVFGFWLYMWFKKHSI
jgi:uncharacterized membrane protein YdjX (TVP38/TMEM64 family)